MKTSYQTSRAGEPLTIDESDWPLAVLRFEGRTEDSDISRLLLWYSRALNRNQPFALVLDLRDGIPPSRPQQHQMNDFLDRNREAFTRQCVGTAYIGPTVLVRMALRAMMRLFRQPFPTVVVATPEEALSWCRAALDMTG